MASRKHVIKLLVLKKIQNKNIKKLQTKQNKNVDYVKHWHRHFRQQTETKTEVTIITTTVITRAILTASSVCQC